MTENVSIFEYECYKNLFELCKFRKLTPIGEMKSQSEFISIITKNNHIVLHTNQSLSFIIINTRLDKDRNTFIYYFISKCFTNYKKDFPNLIDNYKIQLFYEFKNESGNKIVNSMKTKFRNHDLNLSKKIKIYFLHLSIIKVVLPKIVGAFKHELLSNEELNRFADENKITIKNNKIVDFGYFICEIDPMLVWFECGEPGQVIRIERLSETAIVTYCYRKISRNEESVLEIYPINEMGEKNEKKEE